MRILIVDDSAVMRKVVERAIRQAGIAPSDVQHAANGEEALALLRTQPEFDLVISDINMPVMDGLEFLERRRAERLAVDTPILMITTEASQSLVLRAIAAGARGYICKPFTPDQIRSRILPLFNSVSV